MTNSALVLLPAALVLILAITTKRVITSLLVGIVSASFIATNFSIKEAFALSAKIFTEETQLDQILYLTGNYDHLYTFGFLIALGALIAIVTKTGGIAAYTGLIRSKLHSKKSVELTTIIISLFLFIDDYLNSLTTGCIMRPLTDKFKIPRVKLAFLLDSLSAPLCVLIPASSWVAMIMMNFKASGIANTTTSSDQIYIQADTFSTYLYTIPYIFYAFFIIISACVIVIQNISFGRMHRQESIALETGNLFGGKEELDAKIKQECDNGSIYNFLLPIGSFLISVIAMLLYTGNWRALGGNNNFITALQHSDSFLALFVAGIISVFISSVYFISSGQLTFKKILHNIKEGFDLMKGPILLLLLAWTLGDILKDYLHVDNYLAYMISGTLPTFLIPMITFVITLLICMSTGSAWGAISIVCPLIIPLIATLTSKDVPVNPGAIQNLYATLGAILSGALAGSHLSPISDATIIASTSAGSYHLDHVTTQARYSIPSMISTVIALLIASLLNLSYTLTFIISFTCGLAVNLILLYTSNKAFNSK